MLMQPQTASQLGGRGEALRKLDDFASSVTELQQICARLLHTNQKLIALFTRRIQPLPSTTPDNITVPLAAQRLCMDMSQSLNMQYLFLQNNIQNENAKFALVSNIIKTRHDTAKNAINNLR
jgi:hypothetical protein